VYALCASNMSISSGLLWEIDNVRAVVHPGRMTAIGKFGRSGMLAELLEVFCCCLILTYVYIISLVLAGFGGRC
jgi:hypothetical protein